MIPAAAFRLRTIEKTVNAVSFDDGTMLLTADRNIVAMVLAPKKPKKSRRSDSHYFPFSSFRIGSKLKECSLREFFELVLAHSRDHNRSELCQSSPVSEQTAEDCSSGELATSLALGSGNCRAVDCDAIEDVIASYLHDVPHSAKTWGQRDLEGFLQWVRDSAMFDEDRHSSTEKANLRRSTEQLIIQKRLAFRRFQAIAADSSVDCRSQGWSDKAVLHLNPTFVWSASKPDCRSAHGERTVLFVSTDERVTSMTLTSSWVELIELLSRTGPTTVKAAQRKTKSASREVFDDVLTRMLSHQLLAIST